MTTDLGMPTVASDPYGHLRGTEPFPDAARRPSPTPSCARTSATPPARSAPSARASSRRSTTGRSCAAPARAIKDRRHAHLPELLVQFEEAVTAAGGVVHWARDAAEANRDRRRPRAGDRAPTRSSRSSRWPPRRSGSTRPSASAGIAALGDRPRRADRPARPTTCRRTSSSRRSTATARRSATSSCARWAAGRPAPGRSPTSRRRWPRRRARTCARSSCAREVGDLRRQLRGRRDRHARRRRVRGQRPDVPDAARDADHGHGHREARADVARTSRSSCSCCRARRPPSG